MLLVEEKQSAMKREERFNERIKSSESEIAVSTLLFEFSTTPVAMNVHDKKKTLIAS